MKPFVLTPRAAQDISEIWEYIAGDSLEAADRVTNALERAILKLAKNPGIGHLEKIWLTAVTASSWFTPT